MRTRESARHTKRANIRIISQPANLSPCFLGFLSVVSENGACQHLVSLPTCFRTAPASSLFCLSQKSAAGLSGPASSMRPGFPAEQEFRNKCPILQEVPPPGSYRLRRHFPRHCNFSTRVRHPYRPLFLRLTSGKSLPAVGYRLCTFRMQRPYDSQNPGRAPFGSPPRLFPSPSLAARKAADYQLAFVTPGIRPLEAISRNWIRLMPNRRM